MTQLTNDKGETLNITLSPGRIVAYEKENDYSFSAALQKGQSLRFADLDVFVRLMTYQGPDGPTGFDGLDDWVAHGYTIPQITDVLTDCKWMGFTDSASAGQSTQPAS